MNTDRRIQKYIYELLLTIKTIQAVLCEINLSHKEILKTQKQLQPATQPDRLLKAAEAGKLINVDAKTIRSWGKKGMLTVKDIGGVDFFLESEVMKFKKT